MTLLLLWSSEVACLKEPKERHKKNNIYHISTLISLPKICLHVFPLQFSTVNALHHTPFVNLSILANLRAAFPQCWYHKMSTTL